MQVPKQTSTMPASLAKQSSAMHSLAWRITYEWDCAKNDYKTMQQMQDAWQGILESANYQCLADKRKETIFFLWHHIRTTTLAKNQVHGRWCNGRFYANWCDLPEDYAYDNNLLKTLPSGHFWAVVDSKGQATSIRYFISSDCENEDKSHFLPLAEPAVSV
jgi:hypothetical protein